MFEKHMKKVKNLYSASVSHPCLFVVNSQKHFLKKMLIWDFSLFLDTFQIKDFKKFRDQNTLKTLFRMDK